MANSGAKYGPYRGRSYAERSPYAAKRLREMRGTNTARADLEAKKTAGRAKREQNKLARTARSAARAERRQKINSLHRKQRFKSNRSKLQSKYRRTSRRARK